MTSATSTLAKPIGAIEPLAGTPFDVHNIELTINDRCDACGPTSQAFVIAGKDGKILMFCGHHGRKLEPTLVAQGFTIVDHREKINEKASASSA